MKGDGVCKEDPGKGLGNSRECPVGGGSKSISLGESVGHTTSLSTILWEEGEGQIFLNLDRVSYGLTGVTKFIVNSFF
ncbi:hypothetical protein M0802_010201 [Mischocyttarus mexicanus]|nr:hypothetical protein M0802_010201 [Mischocyttarus mexicanus]